MGPCLSVGCKRAMAGSSVSSVLKARKLKDSENGLESKDSMFEQQSEEATVHRIPGRMFLNGSSEVASLYTQQGKKGMNQDAMIVWEVSSLLSICLIYGSCWSLSNHLTGFILVYHKLLNALENCSLGWIACFVLGSVLVYALLFDCAMLFLTL